MIWGTKSAISKIMMKKFNYVALLLFSFCVVGFREPIGCPNSSVEAHVTEKWPDNVAIKQIGAAFKELALHMEMDPFGNIWILRESSTGPEQEDIRFLEKYDFAGQLLLRISQKPGAQFNAFTIHKNGDVTVAETRVVVEFSKESGADYHIWFKRFKNDGGLLREAPLLDVPKEKEALFYVIEREDKRFSVKGVQKFNFKIDHGNQLRVFKENGETLLACGDEVYFFGITYGVKIYRLDSSLEVKWAQQVSPFYSGMSLMLKQGELAIDEDNHVYIAFPLYPTFFMAWKEHFGKTLSENEQKKGVLIWRFSEDGADAGVHIWGKDQNISVAGFYVQNNIVTLGGGVLIRDKINRSNDTMENDLVFLKANFLTGNLLDYKVIDLQREDLAWDFQVDKEGGGVFAGHNDFVQVDTGSLVEFGQAFVLRVNARGEIMNYAPIRGSRSTWISSIAFRGKGEIGKESIVFAGAYDGPITHSGDNDKNQLFSKGMLGVLKW